MHGHRPDRTPANAFARRLLQTWCRKSSLRRHRLNQRHQQRTRDRSDSAARTHHAQHLIDSLWHSGTIPSSPHTCLGASHRQAGSCIYKEIRVVARNWCHLAGRSVFDDLTAKAVEVDRWPVTPTSARRPQPARSQDVAHRAEDTRTQRHHRWRNSLGDYSLEQPPTHSPGKSHPAVTSRFF